MTSIVGQLKDKSTTSSVDKIPNLALKQSYLINHISKLDADHDVTISGTMIKVTYKKASREQIASSNFMNGIDFMKNGTPVNLNIGHSVAESKTYLNKDKMSKMIASKKSTCDSLTMPKNEASIYVGKINNPRIIHSSISKTDFNSVQTGNEPVNGLNLFKKFQDLKKIASTNHLSKQAVTIKQHKRSSTTHVNLISKPIQLKSSTCDKSQIPPANIKIPKGITIIRVKKSAKCDKMIKSTASEKIILGKSRRKQNINLKRKIDPEETNVMANKVVKKSANKHLTLIDNKQLQNCSNAATDFCEAIIGDKICQNKSLFNTSSNSKKEILLDDPDLPTGWKRVVHTRYEGTQFAKRVVYIYSPQGKKFQFKWKLRRYLERTKSPLSAEQFYFGLYKKTKSTLTLPAEETHRNISSEGKPQMNKDKIISSCSLNKSPMATKTKTFNLKHSNSASKSMEKSRISNCNVKPGETSSSSMSGANKKELLLYDPDLPFGWKRIINAKTSSGRLQVNIISPEGRIFRRRYRLHEYLAKNQYNHNLDRFYFGLYPKKDLAESKDILKSDDKKNQDFRKDGELSVNVRKSIAHRGDEMSSSELDSEELTLSEADMSKFEQYAAPMYDDPKLPKGWKRFIKIRACGKRAGKMEVIIVSPDGKRLRSKGQLENYIRKNELNYSANDFDFSVFGQYKRRFQAAESKVDISVAKRRNKSSTCTDRPIPDLDLNSIKETKITPEGELINAVTGMMISCNLSSERSERRLRVPKKEHEKYLKAYLHTKESEMNSEEDKISSHWVQKLVKCRSDFKNLEPKAANSIADRTKEFIKALCVGALQESENLGKALKYEDLANVVHKFDCLEFLKTLIPKKITFKEYKKLNRPKQFLSFT